MLESCCARVTLGEIESSTYIKACGEMLIKCLASGVAPFLSVGLVLCRNNYLYLNIACFFKVAKTQTPKFEASYGF